MKSSSISKNSPILVFDLDGTLLCTDSLWELFFLALGMGHFKVFLWVFGGRVYLKRHLAEAFSLNLDVLPWNENIVSLARKAHENGAEIWLATAADQKLAAEVVGHFGFFKGFLASDGNTNLKGAVKANALVKKFGYRGFIYAGDSRSDLKIWEKAAEAWVFSDSVSLATEVESCCNNVRVFSAGNNARRNILKALRPHQWLKNILLFVPLFLAHDFTAAAFISAVLALIVFCGLSSAGYLINDLLDLESDRRHPKKRFRPFACGSVSLQHGAVAIILLLAMVFLLVMPVCVCVWGGGGVFVCAVTYFMLTLLYSLKLKTIFLLDVIVLTLLFVLRIIAGGFAIGMGVSQWILCFSFFVFLALSLIKRLVELNRLDMESGTHNERRAYIGEDKIFLQAISSGCICGAVMTIAIYIGDRAARLYYASPWVLLFFCPILFYWLARLLHLAGRGRMDYDPVFFVLRDKVSYVCGGLMAFLYVLASVGVGN